MTKLLRAFLILGFSIHAGLALADNQVGEGVEEIVTSPAEVPKGAAENADSDAPVVSTTGGAAVGSVETAEDATEGATDIVEGTVEGLTGN
jgi:hypothetical protein